MTAAENAAFDRTGLAMFERFPPLLAFVDLTWGAVLSASVSVAATVSGIAPISRPSPGLPA